MAPESSSILLPVASISPSPSWILASNFAFCLVAGSKKKKRRRKRKAAADAEAYNSLPQQNGGQAHSPRSDRRSGEDPNWRRGGSLQRNDKRRPPPGLPLINTNGPLLPPVTRAMPSIGSDDEDYAPNRHSPHSQIQRRPPNHGPIGNYARNGHGACDDGDTGINPQAPPKFGHISRENSMHSQPFQPEYSMNSGMTRHPSTRTDELPSLHMDSLQKWASLMSNESEMSFESSPIPLGPVKSSEFQPRPSNSRSNSIQSNLPRLGNQRNRRR